MLPTITKDQVSGDAYLNLSCPACACLPVPHFKDGRYFIDRCPDCDFVYVRNVPADTPGAVRAGSAARTRTAGRLSKRIENWMHVKRIASYAHGRRRLLHIGCGDGHLLSSLHGTGKFTVEGIDATMPPTKFAGFSVKTGNLVNQVYPDERFDFIVGIHMLDRVHHLGEFFLEVKRVLSKHGRAYFVLHRGAYIEPPDRLWQFSVSALQLLFAYHGFRVLFTRRTFGRPRLAVLTEKFY
ncbi:class I SAM-dependent methyltransferase [Burkholderia vietnamiensis]|uniref:class I SAM-dependent methyltransferase n=1 Tax=Burkholderia vietnamiensis TaxID=60552 RepID=UPI001592FBA2|nr:methyltransferase domain-containing protein [Burkholderia vietnamiensis]MBH9647542.1 methyltransferase domain-containing protein [Burkholderia vietnamiensis]MBR8007851.1 methyltransferase domain-containing protein [Burkholderia vietnamiensis]MBR8206056.1 methyltransferase domain-containing protein [Burkholderia vietnamiensis]MCA8289868.1 class I SAM-dependent methyltransferase [Burkholderia vietnamiensis]